MWEAIPEKSPALDPAQTQNCSPGPTVTNGRIDIKRFLFNKNAKLFCYPF
jgi:hypothetical protein